MAQNPLKRVHDDAGKDTRRLGELFDLLGNLQNPNTPLLDAYKNANLALKQSLQDGGGISTARGITGSLRQSLEITVKPILEQARANGAESARRQLGYYGLQAKELTPNPSRTGTVYEVVDAKAKEQETAVMALLLGEADESLVLGDDSRQGVLRPYDVITTAAFWIAWMFWDGFSNQAAKSRKGDFNKQVVAALDHRTTDCCLRAHGQIVSFQDKFKLTGTPRFADELDWTPFHHLCRSSIVLYLPGYDDGLTDRMKESASKVLDERARGINKYRHPSNAFVK